MKQKSKIFLSLCLTIILVSFLLLQIKPKDFAPLLGMINWRWAFLAFLFLIISYFFQAQRFRFLLKSRFNLWRLFNVVCVHNFFLNILPFRSGEISYLYLMKKSGQVKIGENLSSLVIARFLDFFAFSFLFFISMFLVFGEKIQFFLQATLALILFLVLSLIIFIAVFFYPRKSYLLAEMFFNKAGLKRFAAVIYIQKKLEEFFDAIQGLKPKKFLVILFAQSLIIWFFFYGVSFSLVRGIGLEINFWQTVFAFSLPLFMAVFLIQGVAGLGTLEGGWALGLILVGFPKNLAVSGSFVIHGLILICFFLLAAFGFINLKNKVLV